MLAPRASETGAAAGLSPPRWNARLSAAIGVVSASVLSMFSGADVGSLDAGELGGAAFSLGVPHPSGFALDMLLLRAVALLPLGTLAFRQNLCTSLIAAAAVGCIAFLCMRVVQRCGATSLPAAAAAGCVSAAALLGSRTLLDAALNVEVYASSLLCLTLAGVLADATLVAQRRALWPLAGLALGAHITAALLIAPLLLCVSLQNEAKKTGSARRMLGLAALAGGSCALILCYLPLASLRDTAFDWGDPETLSRFLRHISAARIREAYADALFTRDGLPRVRLVEQLTEQPYWLSLALVGIFAASRTQRRRALALGVVLSLDLAYASWINPMGVAQRQVGHASIAVIAIFAGCGGALIVERLRTLRQGFARFGAALAASTGIMQVMYSTSELSQRDGYAVSERYGAGSPLHELAPRALYMCESDSACASALFAVYAEGTRPDLDVVPAQHLWDPAVVRRLRSMPLSAAADAAQWPEPSQRALIAARRQRELWDHPQPRPIYLERVEHLGLATHNVDLHHLPFIRVHAPTTEAAADSVNCLRLSNRETGRRGDQEMLRGSPAEHLPSLPSFPPSCDPLSDRRDEPGAPITAAERGAAARGGRVDAGSERRILDGQGRDASDVLVQLERARFGDLGPGSPLARGLWASGHETLAAVLLQRGDVSGAVAEFARTVALTPLRAAARSNLGVALERHGDLSRAIEETARAVDLDPLRATPWVNLTRLLLRVHGPDAARAALSDASRYELHDPRLDALTRELQATSAHGTTRK